MRKLFRTLHLWLALPAGVFAVILCLTGAILVYQRDIQQALGASQYYVPAHEGRQALPLDTLVRVASRVAEADSRQLFSMTLYADPSRTLDVGVAGQKGAAYNLNPYTAEVTGEGAPATRFFTDVRALYRWLMMSGEGRTAGRVIIGISTLFFLFILVSGVLIALPKSLAQWRQFLTVKRGRKAHVWWYTSHRAFGWYCVVFLFLMTATGPMWSFDWCRSGIAGLFGIDLPQRSGKGHGQKPAQQPDALVWEQALAQIKERVPHYVSISLSGHSATVKTPAHHYRASDTYKFDRRGNITTVERYADQPAARKVMGYAYLLHTGVWGGWLVKLLYFVACLGGAYLAVSGYWLYFKRATGRK